MKQDLAIITVVYENYEVIKDFFTSLENQSNKNFHLFIVDLSVNKQPLAEPSIRYTLISSQNKGYAHGVNKGIHTSIENDYQFYCVINDDTYFEGSFVQNILQSLNNHPNTIIGGKIYYAPGYEYHKNRYSPDENGKVIWYAGGMNDWENSLTVHRGVDEVDNGQYNSGGSTEFVTGCCICFDKSVLEKVGWWDESYFLYFEDADYCERAKRKGIHLYYDPSIRLWHKNAQSTSGSGSSLHIKYQRKNLLKFGLKYAPFKTKFHLLKNYLFFTTR